MIIDGIELLIPLDLQMFAKDGPGGEKTEEATGKRLKDAREEGKVAKSKELTASAQLVSLFILLKVFMTFVGSNFVYVFQWAYGMIPDVVATDRKGLSIQTYNNVMFETIIRMLIIMSPFLIVSFLVSFIVNLVQVKFVISGKPLQPKLDKFNPVNGFKRIFSKESLFELLKSVVKLIVVFYVAYTCIKKEANSLFVLYELPLKQALALVGDIIINTGLIISIVYVIIGIADYIFQKRKFKEDMKMTKQEIKDEYKETEGDPNVKGQQKQRMREASRRRMMQDVPKADVVITNPTHIAVAIRYQEGIDEAPVVLAKGEDLIAERIKQIARENNVEIVEDVPLARMLNKLDIGQQIPPELYETVATILANIYRARM